MQSRSARKKRIWQVFAGFPNIATGRELYQENPLPMLIGGTVFAFIDTAAEGTLDYPVRGRSRAGFRG